VTNPSSLLQCNYQHIFMYDIIKSVKMFSGLLYIQIVNKKFMHIFVRAAIKSHPRDSHRQIRRTVRPNFMLLVLALQLVPNCPSLMPYDVISSMHHDTLIFKWHIPCDQVACSSTLFSHNLSHLIITRESLWRLTYKYTDNICKCQLA